MPDVKAAEGSASRFLMHSASHTHSAWPGYVSLTLTQMINGLRITGFLIDTAALWR